MKTRKVAKLEAISTFSMHEMGWICTLKRPIELLTPNLLSNRGFNYKVQGAKVGYTAALFDSGKMSVRKCEIQFKIHIIKTKTYCELKD